MVVPFAVIAGKTQSWALAAVALALKQDGWDPVYEHMTRAESYFDLMSASWTGEDLCVVEHDIVVWPGALQQLEDCEHGWCTLPYYCSLGWIVDGLGCTKFSGKFQSQYPDFFSEPFPSCCAHDRNYCGLDRLIAHRMMELEIQPHVHSPGVVNLNDRWT